MLWTLLALLLMAVSIAPAVALMRLLEADPNERERIEALLLPQEEEALNAIGRQAARSPLLWVGIAVALAIPHGAGAALRPWIPTIPSVFWNAAASALSALLVLAWTGLYTRRRRLREVRALLNERGFPTCLACGYDLQQLQGDTCPECGTAFASNATEE